VRIRYQSSVFFVRDVEASRCFYEGLLEQEVTLDHGECVGFAGGFSIWQAAYGHQVVFGEPPGDEGQLGRGNCELYFETDDLDAAWERLSAAGVAPVHAVTEQPWGQRVLRVYDPDGHIVELGEPMAVVIRRFWTAGWWWRRSPSARPCRWPSCARLRGVTKCDHGSRRDPHSRGQGTQPEEH